jgi:hypothetical protein
MAKTPKTAPELERYILMDMRNCASCNSVSAITVSQVKDRPDTNWGVSHINVPGGVVPPVCQDICEAAVERLRVSYDLVTEIEPEEI